MPKPSLNIPAPPEELAVDAVLQTLRDDSGVINGHVAVEGPEGDRLTSPTLDGKENAPDFNGLPLIRLYLGDYPTNWITEGQHRGQLDLHFELFAPGTHYGDRLRLWSVWHNALFPQDPGRRLAVRARFGNVNVTAEKLKQGGTKTLQLGTDQYAQKTVCTYTLTFDVNT